MNSRGLWFAALGLLVLIVVPRLYMLNLGLDVRRLSDTNLVPTTLSLLSHANSNTLLAFFNDDHKYPLLGAYALVPPVAAYYAAGHLQGIYKSPSDFLAAYALKNTTLYRWTEVYMLLLNLIAIALLGFFAYYFTSHQKLRVALFALLFAGLSPFLLLFSIQTRIHSFIFFFSVLALGASLLLLKRQNFLAYLCAFGAAALCAGAGQNGAPALVMPFVAHYLSTKAPLRYTFFSPYIWAGFGCFILVALLLGYPSLLLRAVEGQPLLHGLISAKHPAPLPELRGVWLIFGQLFFQAEVAATWLIGCALVFWCRKKFAPDDAEKVALAHIAAYIVLFAPIGWLVSTYFAIAVLPSVLFLAARFAVRLPQKRLVMPVLWVLLAVQGVGIVLYTSIARGGDTTDQASAYLLAHTTAQDRILGSLDHHVLAVALPPAYILPETAGTDALVRDLRLTGPMTRDYTWQTGMAGLSAAELKQYSYVLVDEAEFTVPLSQTLSKAGFAEDKLFLAHASSTPLHTELFSLPSVGLLPDLFTTYRSGSTLHLFKQGAL